MATRRKLMSIIAVAIAGSFLATASVSAKSECTVRMADMPGYDPSGRTTNYYPDPKTAHKHTVQKGEVLCGGPGDDFVGRVAKGGTFLGRQGDDGVTTLRGTFLGHDGADEVGNIYRQAVFLGGRGPDRVDNLDDGRFSGGPGRDYVELMGTRGEDIAYFAGGKGADRVEFMEGGRFFGARGNDGVAWHSGGAYFGGPGWDTAVKSCSPRRYQVEVTWKAPTSPCHPDWSTFKP